MSDHALILDYIVRGPKAIEPNDTAGVSTVVEDSSVLDYLRGAAECLALTAKKAVLVSGGNGDDVGEMERSTKRRRRSSDRVGQPSLPDMLLESGRAQMLLMEDEPAVERACQLISKFRFSHEHVGDSKLLVQPRIWSTMLDAGSLPMTALLRNLGRLSAIGVASVREQDIAKRLSSEVAVKASRLHPISLLEAMRVYESGKGDKGSLKWTPSQPILDALEVAFYSSFKNVGPTGLRYLLGVDVSGSMDGAKVLGMQSLSARDAAAAMLMALMRSENPTASAAAATATTGADGTQLYQRVLPMAFSSDFQELRVHAGMKLKEVSATMRQLRFGSTDCAQPMLHALRHRIPVDVFVILTDNETYFGSVHPMKALEEYRREMSMPHARLAVLAFSATKFSIADPMDPGTMDIAGLDSAVPRILREFALGEL